MIPTDIVFRQLYLADPYGATESALRTTVSSALNGRPVGTSELADSIGRLEARHFVTSTRDIDDNPVWSLTADGRTEATRRFR